MDTLVIIGAGHAAGQLLASLIAGGYKGKIQLIGDEPHLPYQRPPLSKHYLQGEYERERLYLKTEAFYWEAGVELLLHRRAMQINREEKTVLLDNGMQLAYTKLVLATGTRPRKLSIPGAGLAGIYYLRNIEDADRIRPILLRDKKLLISGGGYIGLEVAAAAVERGMSVTLLEMAPRILNRVAPREIADFYTNLHREKGVDIRTNVKAERFEGTSAVESVVCSDGKRLNIAHVLVGIGVVANTELAQAAGLEVENGIKVNAFCQTSDPDIYAAGDCTQFWSSFYQRHLRLESVQNALGQARVVAAQLCEQYARYDELPWFWSDQYGVKLQIAGLADDYDTVIQRGQSETKSFTVFYLKQDRLVAVYAINSPQEFVFSKTAISKKSPLNTQILADITIPIKQALATDGS